MRSLRYLINVTLDGCCDHREVSADEDLHRHAVENLEQADALLWSSSTSLVRRRPAVRVRPWAPSLFQCEAADDKVEWGISATQLAPSPTNRADLVGHRRTRRHGNVSSGGHLRTRRDTPGHATNTVRDREAGFTNPGAPTILVFTIRGDGAPTVAGPA
jgi:hypothetical protein